MFNETLCIYKGTTKQKFRHTLSSYLRETLVTAKHTKLHVLQKKICSLTFWGIYYLNMLGTSLHSGNNKLTKRRIQR